MTVRWENGVLVACDDCMIQCRGKILHNQPVHHAPVNGDTKLGHEWLLKALSATLVYRFSGYEFPRDAEDRILKAFEGNTQFPPNEVRGVLDSWKRPPMDAPTKEQWNAALSGKSEKDVVAAFDDPEAILPRRDWWPRLSPPSGLTECDTWIALGQCTQGPPVVRCESCGEDVVNVPTRVLRPSGWLMHAGCRASGRTGEAPAKKAHPTRHATGSGQIGPRGEHGELDFFLLHPACPKPTNAADGSSLMFARTVWVGSEARRAGLALSFVCAGCGVEDAIEPRFGTTGVEVVSEEKGRWKHFESPLEFVRARREGGDVEFKETWRIDASTGAANDTLREEVIRSVCAFRNSAGGSILIGVTDLGDIVGLHRDYAALHGDPFHASDILQRQVRDHVLNRVSRSAGTQLQIEISETDGGDVLMAQVPPGDAPEEVIAGPRQGFWIRGGPQTVRLDGEEKRKYIERRFPTAVPRSESF